MDTLIASIREVLPTDPLILPLIERHLSFARASSPPCSVHAMDAEDMVAKGVRFFAAFDGDLAVAMGALKKLTPPAGELKSMHVHSDYRGAGLADAILETVLRAAREAELSVIYLETGSQAAFAPARNFYTRHGFAYCPPFEGYVEDPESVFMTRPL